MHLPLLSLKSRLGLLRRRRRVSALKQVVMVLGPVVVGVTLVLVLAAVGSVVSPGH